jgi:hypothetical protein
MDSLYHLPYGVLQKNLHQKKIPEIRPIKATKIWMYLLEVLEMELELVLVEADKHVYV